MGYGFGETQTANRVSEERTPSNAMPSSTEKSSRPLQNSSPTQDSHILSRLKRRASPDPADNRYQPSTSSQPVNNGADDGQTRSSNAFDRLMHAAEQPREKHAVRSNLVDEQAEESDEDNGWAPIGGPEEEDDEDEEDGYVHDLVDDAQVDEEEEKRQDELAAEKAR